jgi:hypothetical protein
VAHVCGGGLTEGGGGHAASGFWCSRRGAIGHPDECDCSWPHGVTGDRWVRTRSESQTPQAVDLVASALSLGQRVGRLALFCAYQAWLTADALRYS